MENKEKKNNPSFDFKSLKLNQSQEILLKSAKPVATGAKTFSGETSNWYLWAGEVENTTCKMRDGTAVPNHTGEIVFFTSSEKMNDELLAITEGKNSDVKIKVTVDVYEKQNGQPGKRYVIEKLSEGKPSASSLTAGEKKLLDDFKFMTEKEGMTLTSAQFITEANSEVYGNIHSVRAKRLYDEYIAKEN